MSRRVPGRVLAGLAVVVAAALAYDAIFWVKLDQARAGVVQQGESRQAAYNAAPAQAQRAAEVILSYRYDRLEDDAAAATRLMTPDYAESYQATVDDLLAAPASQVKARVRATVKEAGVSRVAPGEVDVLLFVDQTSRTTARPAPQTALNRVVMTMVEQDGRWLVDEITAL